MQRFFVDARYSVRSLLKDRGFTTVAGATLGICIGTNVAVFSIVTAIVLRPLPLPESDRIVAMANQLPKFGIGRADQSGVTDYFDRLRGVTALAEQALYNTRNFTVEIDRTPERVVGNSVTPSFFRVLGVAPAFGRWFRDEEGEAGQEQKVILSHALCQQLFDHVASAVGRDLRIDGRPYTIVGVMPREFRFVDPNVRLWIPVTFTDDQKSDANRLVPGYINIGRLRPDATIEQVKGQVDAVNRANIDRFPQYRDAYISSGFYTSVEQLRDMVVYNARSILYLLWAGAVSVLLIGAVNVANLVLARASGRRREFATRLALGASRAQLLRQLVTEHVLLTLAGSVIGLLCGAWLLELLLKIGLERLPRAGEVQIDPPAVLVTFAVAIVIGIVLGITPFGYGVPAAVDQALREEGRTDAGSRRARRMRRTLVVVQVGFAFVLLVGGGLLFATFRQLLAEDLGFEAMGVATAVTNLPASRYSGAAEMRSFVSRAIHELRELPGAARVAISSGVPFDGSYISRVVAAEGHVFQSDKSFIAPRRIEITPGYFATIGMRLVRGRDFDDHDVDTAKAVAIVDERLANRLWPGLDPIGRRVYLPNSSADVVNIAESRMITIVGVVATARLEDIAGDINEAGAFYTPYAQRPLRRLVTFVVKTARGADAIAPALRARLHAIDPELPLFDIQTMEQRAAASLQARRAAMVVTVLFSAAALLLAALGVYGVLAYLVAQRRREIGIRIAVGGTARHIAELVLREAALLIGAGLVAGVAGTAVLARLVERLLYHVRPSDPLILGVAVAALAIVGVAACLAPTRRAIAVDPVIVLAQE